MMEEWQECIEENVIRVQTSVRNYVLSAPIFTFYKQHSDKQLDFV